MKCSRTEYVLRYLLFFFGLSCIALGIALTTLASLGTTPISALPFVASLGFPPSMGFFSATLNLLLLAFQVIVTRGTLPRIQYLQIPVSLFFGILIDFWMYCIPVPEAMSYMWSLAYLATGTFVLAFGTFVEVSANVAMTAAEGIVLVVSKLLRREFGDVKTAFDITLVLLAVLLSLLLFGSLQGVREGTLVSAVSVGVIVKFLFSLQRRMGKGMSCSS